MKQVSFEDLIEEIKKIDGWLWHGEIVALYRFASLALQTMRPNESMVEIGSWKGRSTVTIGMACKAMKKGTVYAIDPYDTILSHEWAGAQDSASLKEAKRVILANLIKFGLRHYVKPIELRSQDAYRRYMSLHTRFIFIDGDHAYEAVHFDVSHWGKTLVDGGYLLLHDTVNHRGPRVVFLELLRDRRYIYIGTTGDLSCFQKVRRLTLRNWLKKVYGYGVFLLLFRFYTPTVS